MIQYSKVEYGVVRFSMVLHVVYYKEIYSEV